VLLLLCCLNTYVSVPTNSPKPATIKSMKRQSLLLYIFVTTINIFLFLPVLFYPILIAPLHILLYILSYNWLFKQKTFRSNWNRLVFSGVSVVGQIILILTFLISDFDSPAGILSLLDNLFIIVLFLISLVEFVVLLTLYSKYLSRQQIS